MQITKQPIHAHLLATVILVCLPGLNHVYALKKKGNADIGDQFLFIVLSQQNSYHVKRAEEFQRSFDYEVQGMNKKPDLHFLHKDWSDVKGGWTIVPLFNQLLEDFKDKKWVVICEEETRIQVQRLVNNLAKYDADKEIYLGKGLKDRNRVITHHFHMIEEKYGFSYPDFAAGMALSFPLMNRVVQKMKKSKKKKMGFAIDPKHELAFLIFDEGSGPVLKSEPYFCTIPYTEELEDEDEICATSLSSNAVFPECGEAIADDDLFIAVKTCEKNHETRVPIVKDLWADDFKNIEFYSETLDDSIPTVDLGIVNTPRGHCGKLQAILENAYDTDYIKNKTWLVITDDDTLLSIPRLKKLLACYDPTESVALGERYGYSVDKGGYDYITGGGGIVLSMHTVRRIVECKSCVCGKITNPDDMMLGGWLERLQIPITHSPLFHQARVEDYAPEFLEHQLPVSFHKFWENNPKKDFMNYLSDKETKHDEL